MKQETEAVEKPRGAQRRSLLSLLAFRQEAICAREGPGSPPTASERFTACCGFDPRQQPIQRLPVEVPAVRDHGADPVRVADVLVSGAARTSSSLTGCYSANSKSVSGGSTTYFLQRTCAHRSSCDVRPTFPSAALGSRRRRCTPRRARPDVSFVCRSGPQAGRAGHAALRRGCAPGRWARRRSARGSSGGSRTGS
jgi:hypothetical protein